MAPQMPLPFENDPSFAAPATEGGAFEKNRRFNPPLEPPGAREIRRKAREMFEADQRTLPAEIADAIVEHAGVSSDEAKEVEIVLQDRCTATEKQVWLSQLRALFSLSGGALLEYAENLGLTNQGNEMRMWNEAKAMDRDSDDNRGGKEWEFGGTNHVLYINAYRRWALIRSLTTLIRGGTPAANWYSTTLSKKKPR